jgi:pimeloyl-ACP methyl ester carboxylesterase
VSAISYVDLPGVRLWYDDTGGEGLPVVFMHPAAGSSESWVSQLPAFTAAGFRCITYDLRGWRNSRQPAAAAGAGHMSDDLEVLTQHLGLDRFVLIAAAYGGFGGLEYALRFPHRLRAFVLATSQGGLVDPDFVAVRIRAAGPEIRALPIQLRELGPSYRAENPEGVARWIQILEAAGGEPTRQPLALDVTLPMLESLRVPTLLLAGDADLLGPPSLMRLMAARIPHCEFATVPEAGHSAHWERPEEWNRIVLEYLRRQ